MEDAVKAPYCTGCAHLSFSAGSREAVDELSARLKDDGFELVSCPGITGDGYYEIVIVGIEGNLIEIAA